MSSDAEFIRAIQAAPQDNALRLVYADWLEERGDPRGEYLRAELALAAVKRTSKRARPLRERLIELRLKIDSHWLATFDQPALLRANPTPYPAAWWGIPLKPYRPITTDDWHEAYPYDQQPPLPVERFDGKYQWLMDLGSPGGAHLERESWQQEATTRVNDLRQQARDLNLTLPDDYVRFLTDPRLQYRIHFRSRWQLDIPARIAVDPKDPDCFLIRFCVDALWQWLCYLRLDRHSFSCVVVGRVAANLPAHRAGLGRVTVAQVSERRKAIVALDREAKAPTGDLWYCAPSVEAFVYRWWIEHEIAGAKTGSVLDRPFLPHEERYVDHLARARLSGP